MCPGMGPADLSLLDDGGSSASKMVNSLVTIYGVGEPVAPPHTIVLDQQVVLRPSGSEISPISAASPSAGVSPPAMPNGRSRRRRSPMRIDVYGWS